MCVLCGAGWGRVRGEGLKGRGVLEGVFGVGQPRLCEGEGGREVVRSVA